MSKFERANPSRKIKLLLYGPSDSGKTLALLSFPRLALVDSERGADWHFDKPGIELPARNVTRDPDDLLESIAEARTGSEFDSFGVDTITIFYDMLTHRQRAARGAQFGYSERGLVNEQMRHLYSELTSLPTHVVVVARETDAYIANDGGKGIRKTGEKAQGDKSIFYPFDFVIRMGKDYSGVVEKSRGSLPKGYKLKQVNFNILMASLTPGDLRNAQESFAFCKHWNEQGVSNPELLAALGVSALSEWEFGRAAADARVGAWLSEQIGEKSNNGRE